MDPAARVESNVSRNSVQVERRTGPLRDVSPSGSTWIHVVTPFAARERRDSRRAWSRGSRRRERAGRLHAELAAEDEGVAARALPRLTARTSSTLRRRRSWRTSSPSDGAAATPARRPTRANGQRRIGFTLPQGQGRDHAPRRRQARLEVDGAQHRLAARWRAPTPWPARPSAAPRGRAGGGGRGRGSPPSARGSTPETSAARRGVSTPTGAAGSAAREMLGDHERQHRVAQEGEAPRCRARRDARWRRSGG